MLWGIPVNTSQLSKLLSRAVLLEINIQMSKTSCQKISKCSSPLILRFDSKANAFIITFFSKNWKLMEVAFMSKKILKNRSKPDNLLPFEWLNSPGTVRQFWERQVKRLYDQHQRLKRNPDRWKKPKPNSTAFHIQGPHKIQDIGQQIKVEIKKVV